MLLPVTLGGCVPQPTAGSLAPTLSIQPAGGDSVAFQDGIPVPTFDPQPRQTLDLTGKWRVERDTFDSNVTLTDRRVSLTRIETVAGGRELPGFDDSAWSTISVPGSVNPPPDYGPGSAWYRLEFSVPASWAGRAMTLKFGAANYIADVWLNGHYLGYHEGGFTPFAFDASSLAIPGERNLLAVRVDVPEWGTRNDIVPWGLADWWNYGGLTQPVWMEASNALLAARADVVPHLDGADVAVTLEHRKVPEKATPPTTATPAPSAIGSTAAAAGSAGASAAASPAASAAGSGASPAVAAVPASPAISSPVTPAIASPSMSAATPVAPTIPATAIPTPSPTRSATSANVVVELLPAVVDSSNLLDLDAADLVPLNAEPLGRKEFKDVSLGPGGVTVLRTTFGITSAHAWAIGQPGLYVVRVTVDDGSLVPDEVDESFGLRHVSVDPEAPRVLLNGHAAAFTGVSVHDEAIAVTPGRGPLAEPLTTVQEAYGQLSRAREVNATLVRTAHQPGVPSVLMLADRLGIAVWEEIPLYHFTPLTFQITLGRGIPQQMLREMALRDMNRPSVLFYGLANESTGGPERASAMATLNAVAHDIDGTRLTGQASYGFDPTDSTSAALDVVGYTLYYGVFYGDDITESTQRALVSAHQAYPSKPLLVLEFGRWADPPEGPVAQRNVLEKTQAVIGARTALREGGYVAGSVWWSLDDYFTMRPGITLERFGLFNSSGAQRPAGAAATRLFGEAVAENVKANPPVVDQPAPQVAVPVESTGASWQLAGYFVYGLLVTVGMLGGLLILSQAFGLLRRRLLR